MRHWRTFVSNVAAIGYKETAIIRHDKAFLSMVLIQPWIMFFLASYVLSNKPADVPWAVLDRSHTALSRRFVETVQATRYFLPPQTETSYEGARARLRTGKALAVLVIPQSLARDAERGEPRVQLLLDGSDPLSAARIGGYVSQVASAFEPRIGAPLAFDPDRPVRSAGAIEIRQRFWFNPTLADREFFLAALAGMLLTNLCLSGTSLGLVGERESGTYEQMLALPTRPIEIVLGKLVPFVGISYLVMLFAVIVPALCFGYWPQGSWLALFWTTLPFVLASLAIGVLVSTLVHTSAQAVFITVFFMLPSYVLSGVMMPYQFMPPGIREVGALLPLRWYQIAFRRIIERGGGIVETAVPTLAMFAIFAVLLALIRWRMKPRLG
ncbi:MAG TPA: ABC transporter permease [Candidatus Binatia bacterium]|nr:ABC transporter permease [Candidatus Binatia bacterium]